MATGWLSRAAVRASRFVDRALAEPGELRTFEDELINLKDSSCIKLFRILTDQHLKGQSTAELHHSMDDGGCLSFHGTYSSIVPPDAPANVHRLGQASLATKVKDGCYFYLGDYDQQVASSLNFRLRGDGRIYTSFLKTDSYHEGAGIHEIWQASLSKYMDLRDTDWQDVQVPIVDFLLTRDGYLTEEFRVANLRRVVSLGFSVAGGRDIQHDGPFKLDISRIAAGYDASDQSSGREE